MVFKTVAVVGASGSLGAPLVQALLAANFRVTAIAREASTSTFPDGVEVRKADLTSVESLTKALAGQDVVILTIPHAESPNQARYIDAAIAAGVKRFIPAEWGYDTRRGKLDEPVATILISKTQALEYLIEKTKQHPSLTWTGISTSGFLDWVRTIPSDPRGTAANLTPNIGLDYGAFGINPTTKTAGIIDSGNEPVSTSSLAFIAQATVAVLQREGQTANRYVEVVEHVVTQNQLLELLEEETGAKYELSHLHTADLKLSRDEKLAKGDPSSFFDALWVLSFADGAGNAVKEEDTANAELGLKSKDLKEIIKEYVKTRKL